MVHLLGFTYTWTFLQICSRGTLLLLHMTHKLGLDGHSSKSTFSILLLWSPYLLFLKGKIVSMWKKKDNFIKALTSFYCPSSELALALLLPEDKNLFFHALVNTHQQNTNVYLLILTVCGTEISKLDLGKYLVYYYFYTFTWFHCILWSMLSFLRISVQRTANLDTIGEERPK